MERISQLPEPDPAFNPFHDEKHLVFFNNRGDFLVETKAPKWQIWTNRALPLLRCIRNIIFLIYAGILVGLTIIWAGSYPVRVTFIYQSAFLLAAVHIVCSMISAIFQALLAPIHNDYLEDQITQTLAGPCPAQAVLIAKCMYPKEMREVKKESLRPVWDAYLKDKVEKYKKKNSHLAIQYAYCIWEEEERKSCVKALEKAFRAASTASSVGKQTRKTRHRKITAQEPVASVAGPAPKTTFTIRTILVAPAPQKL